MRRRAVAVLLPFALGMGAAPAAAQARDMFVPNYSDQTISVVNTSTNAVIHTINIGTGGPWLLAVSPDGKTAYDVNQDSNEMIPINTATYATGAAITLPGGTNAQPFQVAITPNGKEAYVVESVTGQLVPVNLTTQTAGKAISVGSSAYSLAITPDGKTVYVAASASHEVVPVNTATNTAGSPIAVTTPQQVAVTPNGKTVWVQSRNGDLVPISTATNTAGTPITGLSTDNPFGLAISPSGTMAYWTDGNDNVVYPVNLSTRTVGSAISVGSDAEYPTLTPDGKTLYTSNSLSANLTPISTATKKAGTAITVGSEPGQPGIVPNQGPKAAFSWTASGLMVTLNAGASSDPDGKVVTYVWNFGDGTHTTTHSATTSHTYSTPGSYTVTLTVIDNEGCSTGHVFTGQTMYCNGSSAARTSQTVQAP
jgi:YVTN family beta-propeller protein